VTKILKAPIVEKGKKLLYPKMGTPQGGVISPLLCNLVLNDLRSVVISDEEYMTVMRYADDCVMFIKGDPKF